MPVNPTPTPRNIRLTGSRSGNSFLWPNGLPNLRHALKSLRTLPIGWNEASSSGNFTLSGTANRMKHPWSRRAKTETAFSSVFLEQVADILRQNYVVAGKLDHGSPQSESFESYFTNKFDGLLVEDSIESSEPTQSRSESTITNIPKYTSDVGTSREELLLAMDCLYIDFNRLRILIRHHWDAYRKGAVDLAAVSIMTNTAIDFVRSMQEDFEAAFGCDYHQLSRRHCLICPLRWDMGLGHDPNLSFDPCFYNTHCVLEDFIDGLDDDPWSMGYDVAPSNRELFDTTAEWSSMTPDECISGKPKLQWVSSRNMRL